MTHQEIEEAIGNKYGTTENQLKLLKEIAKHHLSVMKSGIPKKKEIKEYDSDERGTGNTDDDYAYGMKRGEVYGYNACHNEFTAYLAQKLESVDIETICEQVHQAYCIYHKERTGEDYWTKGDYSLLKEDGKEYDRRTVKAVLRAIRKHLEVER